MKRWKFALGLVVALAVTGCGADEPAPSADPKGAESSETDSGPATLAQACPRLEAVWDSDSYVISGPFIDLVLEIKRDSDLETTNAMKEVHDAIRTELDLGSTPVEGGGFEVSPNGHDRVRETIRARCEAAGSSSFS